MCEVKDLIMSLTDLCTTTSFVNWLYVSFTCFFLWVIIFSYYHLLSFILWYYFSCINLFCSKCLILWVLGCNEKGVHHSEMIKTYVIGLSTLCPLICPQIKVLSWFFLLWKTQSLWGGENVCCLGSPRGHDLVSQAPQPTLFLSASRLFKEQSW